MTYKSNSTLTAVIGFALVTAISLMTVRGVFADAPEDAVWNDAPQKSQPSEIGLQKRPVDIASYKKILFVSVTAGSDKTGNGSAAKPFASVTHALRQTAKAGERNRCAILVAAGTYAEPEINTKPYVDLYGGFSSTDFSRDIFTNTTTLDGQNNHRVINASNHCRIDGFTITGGAAPGHGGGILCNRTSPTITNNIITTNKTLAPIGFVHNPDRRRHVGNDGGAIACVDGANPIIAHNIIYNNNTEIGNGSGIACRDDACPKIIYNIIWGNKNGLKDVHDTRSSNGGGISCFAGVKPIISNNIIANNAARGKSDAGAIYNEYNSSAEVTFNFILGNWAADDGGAMEIMKSSQPIIRSNYFAGNRTGGGGGAIRLSDQGLARIHNNIITRNTSEKGGGIACTNAWMICKNNIITKNNAERAGGVLYYNENWQHLMLPVITGNMIWANGDKQIESTPNDRIMDNIVQGGYPGSGNKDAKPDIDDKDIKLTVSKVDFNAKAFLTTLSIANGGLQADSLVGRVVKTGKLWTVIKSNTKSQIVVWGKLDTRSTGLEILPTYR